MSPVMMSGTPAAATTMSASRTWAARSRVPVWQRVTVAFSVRRVSRSPSGRPTVIPRPTTTTSAPAIVDVVAAQQLDDPDRRARQRAGLAEHQLAEVGRVQAVDVLGRVDPGQQRELVEPGRLLHDEAGARRVGVELVDHRLHLGLRSRRRQVAPDRGHPDRGAVLVLGADVPVRARIVTDQHRAQAGRDAVLLERGHALGQLGLDGAEGGGAIEDLCGHGVILGTDVAGAARYLSAARAAGCAIAAAATAMPAIRIQPTTPQLIARNVNRAGPTIVSTW